MHQVCFLLLCRVPQHLPYRLCKLKGSGLVMSCIQGQNVESQLHSMKTPSSTTAAHLTLQTEKESTQNYSCVLEEEGPTGDIGPSVVRTELSCCQGGQPA